MTEKKGEVCGDCPIWDECPYPDSVKGPHITWCKVSYEARRRLAKESA